jgi:REP element-mobilizing transposase RayT
VSGNLFTHSTSTAKFQARAAWLKRKTDSQYNNHVGAGFARPITQNTPTMYNPEIHHRRTIRLQEYDYSSNGLYFVTICTHGHKNIFGKIVDGNIVLSNKGKVAEEVWHDLNKKYPQVICHEYSIMPNHFHGIIQINNDYQGGQTPPLPQTKLGNIIAFFKYRTSKIINSDTPIWQRNYYEHIIRNQQGYEEIVAYIVENPLNWKNDKLYNEK